MKKNILLFLVVLSSCSIAMGQSVESSIKGVVATLRNYEYREDSVYLSLDLDVSDIDISSTQSLVLTPKILKSVDQIADLPTLVLRGRSGSKSYRRTLAVNNKTRAQQYEELYKTTYDVVDYYGKQRKEIKEDGGVINYQYTVPYEVWMAESQVVIGCETYGCCNVENDGISSPMNNAPLSIELLSVNAYDFFPKVKLIKPEKVAVKRRDIQYSAALVFKVNSTYIDPTLSNNQAELNSIAEMMESVVSDADYTITAVNITGYASPEGTLETNQRLSQGRAQALENILKRDYRIPSSLYNVTFGGENWAALIPMIENSDMEDKEEVLHIIQNVDILNGRELQLMKLKGGVPYKYMLKNFFPAVRLVEVYVEYNVDAYDLERIREVIGVKPENLSLEEMYRLSETYDVNSDEFLNIFLTAVKVYPTDQVAINNALVTDILKGEIESASQFANSADHRSEMPEMLNTLGAYYLMAENYEMAEELLQRAVDMGNENAAYNLEQLGLKLENIAKLKEAEELRKKIYGE